MKDVDILSCDLENSYLNAQCHEKIWFEGGIKCGEDHGKILVMVRALYSLKSAGALWWSKHAQFLSDLGYKLMKADVDIWICKVVKPNGQEYYEMLFVYVDEILSLSHEAKEVILQITSYYKAKEGSIKEPDMYLRANVSKIQMPDGHEVWSMSPRTYVKNAIGVVQRLLDEDGEEVTLKSSVKTPFPSGYQPELDIPDELGQKLASHFMQLIEILRWAVELG